MATISKGIKLEYLDGQFSGADNWVELGNLQEIPELGGSADAIEITTLQDSAHRYTNGLMNYGDSLDFKFLYFSMDFAAAVSLAEKTEPTQWRVTLPDNNACKFSGTCSAKLDGVGVNAALTYTLSIKPSSAMEWIYLEA